MNGAQDGSAVDWKRRYDDEYRTVDRCWKALGITTYEQAGGKAIWEIIANLTAANYQLTKALREMTDERNRLIDQLSYADLIASGGIARDPS
jgi:hypothetical protein